MWHAISPWKFAAPYIKRCDALSEQVRDVLWTGFVGQYATFSCFDSQVSNLNNTFCFSLNSLFAPTRTQKERLNLVWIFSLCFSGATIFTAQQLYDRELILEACGPSRERNHVANFLLLLDAWLCTCARHQHAVNQSQCFSPARLILSCAIRFGHLTWEVNIFSCPVFGFDSKSREFYIQVFMYQKAILSYMLTTVLGFYVSKRNSFVHADDFTWVLTH